MGQEVLRMLKDIFHTVAPEIEFDQIDLKLSLRSQVDLDSLDFYRIIVLIHQNTGVNIPDSQLREFKNLEDLLNYISEKSSLHPQQWPAP